ncbi:hypothetical protein K491DRAFT_778736 [Lophiostoma macrostomum CBS 122681]|uniref:Uncharacterized protein n=1 Tax=Lophiostoma macrostomum CBS 122681 TaxID=1314788 RepID=A0A6A6T5Y9_9PLEO|nr:hypothetical protein K491DRAFT_778736 [Lophiostoma macrostomum CBS 122681]
MTTTQAVLSQPESAPSGATRRHSFETSTPDPLDKSAVAFISGPLDATDAYFESHYRRRIDAAIASGHSFVVGPVMGIDTLALEYVLSRIVDPQRVTVYMAFFEYANPQLKRHFENMGVQTKCVGDVTATTRDRDAKMTEDSGYDILSE